MASYNAAADFVDRNVAEGRGAKPAFTDPAATLTYGELLDRVSRVGPALAKLGIGPEDRVLMLMQDTVDFPVVFWGAIRAGVVPVPINTLAPADLVRYMLEDSRAKALFVSAPLASVAEAAAAGLPQLKATIVVGEAAASRATLRDVLAEAPVTATPAATHPDETAFWLYSSGSTGMPKGARHLHSSLAATARLYGEGVLGIRTDDHCYSAAKLFFAYGLGNSMTFPMWVGASSFLYPERPTPAAVFDILKGQQPTLFFGAPTLYAALLANANCTPANASPRLRLCVSAGEPLPEHLGLEWKRRMGVDILDGIGSTEMLHIFMSNLPSALRYGTSGVPVPGYDVRLVDEHDKEVADGEVGELLVSGPSSAEGYWNQRAKSRRTFQGDWTRTGDKYIRDPDGMYRYCGRTDDMFKVSGIWVSPFDVESALITHPAILEAAVVPAEDKDGLLKPKAFVVLKSGSDAKDPDKSPALIEDLKEHVKRTVGVWKYPRWIEIVEGLPMTATGKIQRYKLRDQDQARG
jgi:4-hydroxybenzoate-CoA ligase